MPRKPPSTSPSRDDVPLSPLFHGRVRLLVLATLARRGASSFTDLRRLLALTDGTLSVHLSKLEAAGIVEIIKGFEGKRPRTVVRMTRTGRKRFQCYVRELLEILPDPDASR